MDARAGKGVEGMIQIEVSSFFNQGVWKPVDLETFKRMVGPVDDDELADMLQELKAGQYVWSVFGVSKFRAVPAEPAGGEGHSVTEA